jgi:hypothetical protein
MASKYSIKVGSTWKDAKGRTWEIIEKMPFGRCRVRTTDRTRVGEMKLADAQRIFDAANQK